MFSTDGPLRWQPVGDRLLPTGSPSGYTAPVPPERHPVLSLEAWFWTLLLIVVLPALAVGGSLLVRRAIGPDVLAQAWRTIFLV